MKLFSLFFVCVVLGILISTMVPGIGGFLLCVVVGILVGSQWDKIYDKISK